MLRIPQEGQEKKISDVLVRIKVLRDFECAHYFDNRLVSQGLQPIQMYIQNDTDHFYILDGSNISVPLVGKRGVGAYLYKNTYARSAIWLFGTVALAWQLFLPVFLIDTVGCVQANKHIRSDIESICINPKEKLVIPPHTRIHKVLFVDQDDYHHHIEIRLQEQERQDELVFAF